MTPNPVPFVFRTPAGLSLRGVTWGEGGRDLVFTHGNGFTAQCYAPILAPLSARVRVHGVNLRGHGGSDVPPDFPDWDGPYADLVAYLQERCAAPAILAGHSYGATLSLRLAAEHPELVGGLLLLEPLVRDRAGRPGPRSTAARGGNSSSARRSGGTAGPGGPRRHNGCASGAAMRPGWPRPLRPSWKADWRTCPKGA